MNFGKISENFYLCGQDDPVPTGSTAFFDSGTGGLNVLSACMKRGLSGDVLYYGDNARAPYGEKEREEIRSYAKEAFDEFERRKVARAVIACNTVTALCLEEFQSIYPFPVYGTFPPVEKGGALGGEVFAFVTKATAQSERFKGMCAGARKRTGARIKTFALNGLVGEIEKNLTSPFGVDYEKFLPSGNPDVVVLGCTHYSFFAKEIGAHYRCPVFDCSEETAKRLSERWLVDPLRPLRPFSTTFSETDLPNGEKEGEFPDFSTTFSAEKEQKRSSVFFLGSGKVVNKPTYEQMFALKKG